MKTQLLPKVSLVLVVTGLALAGCSRQPSAAETTAANPDFVPAMQSTDNSPALEQLAADEGDISDAPVQPAEMPKTVTPPVQLNSALSEMIQIAQSGVDENVLIAYVTNCASTFNAGPEEIIYLNDIGIAPEVVTAMIVHDHEMREAAPVPAPIPNAAAPAQLTTVSYTTPSSPTMVDPAFSRQDAGTETYATPAQPAEVSNDDFYGSLAPYGNWVDVTGYGRCWQPTVVSLNPDWRPYCDGGRWVYSDCGWYWLSDYSWGWAPFHYGRWFRHTSLGWCWVPDTTWGPSWVSWRYSDDYCGWAPLPPLACYRPGFGFTYAGHIVAANFEFGLTASCFTFVPFRDFCDRHPRRHIVARHEADQIFHRTVVSTRVQLRNHVVVNNGLPADRVTAATHKDLHPVAVREYRGTAGRGLRLQHLDSGGTALTTERPDRASPTQSSRHPGSQPSAPRANGQLQVNAGGSSYPQTFGQPQRFQSAEGSRANNVHSVTTHPQSVAPATTANANHSHEIVIRSYPQTAANPAAGQNSSEPNAQAARPTPSWLQTGNGFDHRRQQPQQQPQQQAPHNQYIARQNSQSAPAWNQNVPAEPQQLADRRNSTREVQNRSGYGNSFTASQAPAAPQYSGAQPAPRVNYQPPQVQYQSPSYSPPPQVEARSNFRPTENRVPAMESRSESRPTVVESRPAPAPTPAPAPVMRSSSNDRSADRGQDRGSTQRR